MHAVWQFSNAAEDWLPLGAFTKREDADALVAEEVAAGRRTTAIVEDTFPEFLRKASRAQLGRVADVVALSGVAPWPAQVWVHWKQDPRVEYDPRSVEGLLLSVYWNRDDAQAAQVRDGGCVRSVDMSGKRLLQGGGACSAPTGANWTPEELRGFQEHWDKVLWGAHGVAAAVEDRPAATDHTPHDECLFDTYIRAFCNAIVVLMVVWTVILFAGLASGLAP